MTDLSVGLDASVSTGPIEGNPLGVLNTTAAYQGCPPVNGLLSTAARETLADAELSADGPAVRGYRAAPRR